MVKQVGWVLEFNPGRCTYRGRVETLPAEEDGQAAGQPLTANLSSTTDTLRLRRHASTASIMLPSFPLFI